MVRPAAMMVHSYSPNTWEAETKKGKKGLKFKASLDYVARPSQKRSSTEFGRESETERPHKEKG
jgi:hypothetical protein